MPFLARAHPCSKLDHTNRHLSYAVSTNSETQTLHSDYVRSFVVEIGFAPAYTLYRYWSSCCGY